MIEYQKLLQSTALNEVGPTEAVTMDEVRNDPDPEKPDSETMIREELSQLRASSLAKKKREKKKVCTYFHKRRQKSTEESKVSYQGVSQ